MPDNAEDLSLRESISASLEAAEKVPDGPAAVPDKETELSTPLSVEPPLSTETAEEKRARDEKGRFAPKDAQKELPLETKEEKKPEPLKVPPLTEKPPEPAKAAEPAVKAPQSWKPVAREEWAKIPPAIQQEVIRREREITQALQESSEARQGYQKYREAVAPFEGMIRAEGAEPVAAIRNLLQTAYALRTAPPQQKAEIVADIIGTFLPGKDQLAFLDSAIVRKHGGLYGIEGQASSGTAPSPQVYRDPRLDQLLSQVEQMKQQRAQELDSKAAQALEEVQAQEFFEDVREDMADILSLAAKRQVAMTPMEAYNRAVALHPEVSKVVAQRNAARTAAAPNGATQRSMAAASSVRSSPAPAIDASGQPKNLREDIEAAFRASESRT